MTVATGNGTGTIQFSVFELDLRVGELRRNGSKVRLQEQPLQVLVSLLERPGEVVSREELRGRLWPADTFVDFDHSLNAAVRRLRDALGDSAETPRFVETVARRGYRFIAPVSGAKQVQPASAVALEPAHRLRWWILAAALPLLILAIVIGWRAGRSSKATGTVTSRRLTANSVEITRARAGDLSRREIPGVRRQFGFLCAADRHGRDSLASTAKRFRRATCGVVS